MLATLEFGVQEQEGEKARWSMYNLIRTLISLTLNVQFHST